MSSNIPIRSSDTLGSKLFSIIKTIFNSRIPFIEENNLENIKAIKTWLISYTTVLGHDKLTSVYGLDIWVRLCLMIGIDPIFISSGYGHSWISAVLNVDSSMRYHLKIHHLGFEKRFYHR